MRENLNLRDSNEKIKDEKEQLEALLKEILYEREREKNLREREKVAVCSKTNRSSYTIKDQKEINRNVVISPNKEGGSGHKQERNQVKKRVVE
jgi:hypothetical protein